MGNMYLPADLEERILKTKLEGKHDREKHEFVKEAVERALEEIEEGSR